MRRLGLLVAAFALSACGSAGGQDGSRGPGPGGSGGTTSTGSGGGGGDQVVPPDDPLASEVPTRGEDTTSAANLNPPTSTPTCGTFDSSLVFSIDTAPLSTTTLASATRVRELLNAGFAPRAGQLRVEDVFHYYRWDLLGSETLAPGALLAHMALQPRQISGKAVPNQLDLLVGIQAGKALNRPPVVLTLLVDTSSSMQGEPLTRAKATVAALGKGLVSGDRVTLLTSDSSQAEQVVDLTDPASELAALANSIALGADASVVPRISDALASAQTHDLPSSWNRVLVVSNGEGDVGAIPTTALADAAQAAHPILVGSVGVGPAGQYHDRVPFLVARNGHGPYAFIDSSAEAAALFGQRFDELMGVAAGNVSVQVNLPWFMRSLDPKVATGTADISVGHDLSPGAVATFLFHVAACDLTKLQQGGLLGNIELRAQFSNPNDVNANPISVSVAPSDILSEASSEIQKWHATQAYFDAISGGTNDRVNDAIAQLTPLEAADPAGPFAEMKSLTLARQSLGGL